MEQIMQLSGRALMCLVIMTHLVRWWDGKSGQDGWTTARGDLQATIRPRGTEGVLIRSKKHGGLSAIFTHWYGTTRCMLIYTYAYTYQ